MFPPKKILFPVDFSERSVGASHFVEAMAGRFEAELVLLHVVEAGAGYYGFPEPVIRGNTAGGVSARGAQYFRVRRILEKADDAAEKILELSRSENVDLIMMPTTGTARIGDSFWDPLRLKSCMMRIARFGPAFIWRKRRRSKIWASKSCRALDLNPQSGRVLGWANKLQPIIRPHSTWYTPPLCMRPGRRAILMPSFAPAADGRKRSHTKIPGGRRSRSGSRCSRRRSSACCSLRGATAARGPGGYRARSESGLVGRLRANAYSIIRQSPCPVISV